MKRLNTRRVTIWAFATLAALGTSGLGSALAQSPGDPPISAPDEATIAGQPNADNGDQGPVRLVRFSYAKGNVNWRPDSQSDWSPASVNLPIRTGAQVWVTDGGKAELQFDDGSRVRLGNGTIVTLKTLYSDSQGEFTEIEQNEGLSYLNLRTNHSIYQVDTPYVAVNAIGPARLRIGTAANVDVAVHSGTATVEGSQGKATLRAGDFLAMHAANDPFTIQQTPDPDDWDSWNQRRDTRFDGYVKAEDPALPPNIAICSVELGHYGVWRADTTYGRVWCPKVVDATWRPYYHGHWANVEPFGWTWVGDEPWGWAPYHYGTWVHLSFGWGWCPGPANQFWSPAVVSFSNVNGGVAWCALSPREVRYPGSLAIGFQGGDWSLFFSIGGTGCYYPTAGGFCEPRPWHNDFINRNVFTLDVALRSAPEFNHNTLAGDVHFVPANARFGGAAFADSANFSHGAAFRSLEATDLSFFSRGQTVAAPRDGERPSAGPPGLAVTRESFTPTHAVTTGLRPPAESMSRPLFRGSTAARYATYASQSRPTSFTSNGGSNVRSQTFSPEMERARHAREALGLAPASEPFRNAPVNHAAPGEAPLVPNPRQFDPGSGGAGQIRNREQLRSPRPSYHVSGSGRPATTSGGHGGGGSKGDHDKK